MKRIITSLSIALSFAITAWAADLATFKTADDLWKHIAKLQQGPTERPGSEAEAKTMMAAFLTELDQALTAFIEHYPKDPRHWDAAHTRVAATLFRAQVEEKSPDRAAAEKALQKIITAKDAPESVRTDAQCTLILMRAEVLADDGTPADRTAVEEALLHFQKEHPTDRRGAALQEKVQQAINRLEFRKRPVELKFTAIDGRAVDTTKLRGKVVLVDFWATWCGPCRVEMPNVVATYQKYHDKGFEIVGISLDREKEKLLAYTKEKGMAWPQYFDGKQWENEISRRFEIQSIPTAWLLDKTGKVRAVDVRGAQLGKQVEKLLAE